MIDRLGRYISEALGRPGNQFARVTSSITDNAVCRHILTLNIGDEPVAILAKDDGTVVWTPLADVKPEAKRS